MKNNNKGFTIIELLAVIVLIVVVSSIATTGVLAIRNLINESLLSTKIDVLESSAVLWGQDNMVLLVKSSTPTTGNYETYSDSSYGYAAVMTVNDLSDYISMGDNCYEDDGSTVACVQNNLTGLNMKDDKLYIYIKNNRVYAKYVE